MQNPRVTDHRHGSKDDDAAPTYSCASLAASGSVVTTLSPSSPSNSGEAVKDHQQSPHHQGTCQMHSVLAFTLISGLAMCAQSSLAMYNKSIVTSVEKQFEISSWLAGLIAGSFNIGNLLFIIPVAALNNNDHRPRIMGVGTITIAVGGIINFLPHLFLPLSTTHLPSQFVEDAGNLSSQSSTISTSLSPVNTTLETDKSDMTLFYVLLLGEIIQGVGAAFLLPLSSSYIDDFASKENSPLYIGVSLVIQNLGPGIGFLIGSWTSSKHVNFDVIPSDEIIITPDHKQEWIGAWWLGFLILSIFVLVTSVPMFFFPKSMKIPPTTTTTTSLTGDHDDYMERGGIMTSSLVTPADDDDDDGEASCDGLLCEIGNEQKFCSEASKGLIHTVKRLLSNKVYICITIAYTGIMFTVAAMTSFMPKYLEVVFSITTRSANLIFGIAMVCVTGAGLLLGAIILKLYRTSIQRMLVYTSIASFISLIPLALSMFTTCDVIEFEEDVAAASDGASTPDDMRAINQTMLTQGDLTECSDNLVVFLILVCTGAFIASSLVTILYTAVLRLVDPEDKVAGLGILFLIVRGFGMIPAPVLSGAIIDSTCRLWKNDDSSSYCSNYQVTKLRFYYISILFAGMLVCFVFNALGVFQYRRKKLKQRKDQTIILLQSKC